MGVLLCLIGAGGVWLCSRLPMGTALRMGPGYFPTLVSWLLVGFGVVLLLRSVTTRGPAIESGQLRPFLLVLAAVLAFFPLCFNIFWGPMAIVMIGGLIGATILTLVALPAFYLLLFGHQDTAKEAAHD